MTTTAIFNVSLFVGDYMDDDKGLAFEECASDTDAAVKLANEELREEFNFSPLVIAVSAKFSEFDSRNIGHAGAHFDVTVDGVTQEQMDAELDRVYG